MRTLLFLCTGNYYRSRFAELYFNALASGQAIGWQAESRGLATERNRVSGPLSPLVTAELARRGIGASAPRRPLQLHEQDLCVAGLVIALHEEEHRPLLRQRYPDWETRVRYWHVPDAGDLPPAEALADIACAVEQLAAALCVDNAGCQPERPDRGANAP